MNEDRHDVIRRIVREDREARSVRSLEDYARLFPEDAAEVARAHSVQKLGRRATSPRR